MSLSKLATKKVVTIGPKENVRDAAKQMREMHVGDVVVVDEKEGRRVPIGILTDRDIVVSTTAFGVDPGSVNVEDVMSPALVCARMSDSVWTALQAMKEHGVKRLPIVDDSGRLAGILSADDVVGLLAAELGELGRIQTKQKAVEVGRRKKFA